MILTRTAQRPREAIRDEEPSLRLCDSAQEPIGNPPVDDSNDPVNHRNPLTADRNDPVDDQNDPLNDSNDPIDPSNGPLDDSNEPVDGNNGAFDHRNDAAAPDNHPRGRGTIGRRRLRKRQSVIAKVVSAKCALGEKVGAEGTPRPTCVCVERRCPEQGGGRTSRPPDSNVRTRRPHPVFSDPEGNRASPAIQPLRHAESRYTEIGS